MLGNLYPSCILYLDRYRILSPGVRFDGCHVIGLLPSFHLSLSSCFFSRFSRVSLVIDRNVRSTQLETPAVSFVLVMEHSSPLTSLSSAVFLLHILLEAPLIVQGFWYPQSLPFLGMNNTTLVLVKVDDSQIGNCCRLTPFRHMQLLNAISLGTCLTSLLCYGLPGKKCLNRVPANMMTRRFRRVPPWKARSGYGSFPVSHYCVHSPFPGSSFHPHYLWPRI